MLRGYGAVNFFIKLMLHSSDFLVNIVDQMISQKATSMFQETIQCFMDDRKSKKLLKKVDADYLLKGFKITWVSAKQIRDAYNKLEMKYQKRELKVLEDAWHKNQRKIFIWFLIYYCEKTESHISYLTQSQWETIGKEFFNKNVKFVQFQGLSLLKNHKRHNWSNEDDKLLTKLIEEHGSNEWTEISKFIYYMTPDNKFISSKKCRERWLNHINSKVNKDSWTVEEDLTIMRLCLDNGKKWASIARQLKTNRTEHMIKNRYNCLLHKGNKKSSDSAADINEAIKRIESQLIKSDNRVEEQQDKEQSPQSLQISEEPSMKESGKGKEKVMSKVGFDHDEVNPLIQPPKFVRDLQLHEECGKLGEGMFSKNDTRPSLTTIGKRKSLGGYLMFSNQCQNPTPLAISEKPETFGFSLTPSSYEAISPMRQSFCNYERFSLDHSGAFIKPNSHIQLGASLLTPTATSNTGTGIDFLQKSSTWLFCSQSYTNPLDISNSLLDMIKNGNEIKSSNAGKQQKME